MILLYIVSVEDMLRQLSLEKYTKVFQENEVCVV